MSKSVQRESRTPCLSLGHLLVSTFCGGGFFKTTRGTCKIIHEENHVNIVGPSNVNLSFTVLLIGHPMHKVVYLGYIHPFEIKVDGS